MLAKNNLLKLSLILSLMFFGLEAFAKKAQGVFTVVKGDVKIIRKGKTKAKKVRVGTKVKAKDTIIAAKSSRAKVIMVDKNILNISPDTKLIIEAYSAANGNNKKKVILNLLYGKVRPDVKQKYSGKKEVFRVKTPSAVAGVRGTDFFVGHSVKSGVSKIVTFSGQVAVGSGIGASGQLLNPVAVNPGQITSATVNKPPKTPRKMPKSQLAASDNESKVEKREPASKDETKKENKKNKKDKKNKSDNAKKQPKKDGPKNADAKNEDQAGPEDQAKGEAPLGDDQAGNEDQDGANDQANTNEPKPKSNADSTNSDNGGIASGPNGPNPEGGIIGDPGLNDDGRDPASIDPGAGPIVGDGGAPLLGDGGLPLLPPPLPDSDPCAINPAACGGEFVDYNPIDNVYVPPVECTYCNENTAATLRLSITTGP